MADRVGQQLGKYRLIHLLGKGGFAEVYLGEHVRLGTQAAIKVLNTRLARTDEIEGFQNEARTIARLEHPHIVRILDFDVDEDVPFLVMGYAPNGSLRDRHPKGTLLPLSTIVDYVKQVATALQYAHDQKLIHRDIKPENILVGRHDEILLSDFGVALVAQSIRSQSTQEVIGTAPYMAPEQLQGKPHFASDQYALGVIVYEWLCGVRPFQGTFIELYSQHLFAPPQPLRQRIPTISPAVEQVVLKALAKNLQERFASVQAFAEALERANQMQGNFGLSSPFRQSSSSAEADVSPDSPFMQSDRHRVSDSTFLPPEPMPHPDAPAADSSTVPAPNLLSSTILPKTAQDQRPQPLNTSSSTVSPTTGVSSSQLLSQADVPRTMGEAAGPYLPLSQPAQPTMNARKNRSKSKVSLFIGIILIIIMGSVGVFYTSLNKHATSVDGTATAIVNTKMSATAMAQNSATASANIIFSDSLSRNIHNWPVGTNSNALYAFKDGAYHVTAENTASAASAMLPNEILTEPFAYTLTMEEIKGNDLSVNNSFGMIFCFNSRSISGKVIGTFYSFEVVNNEHGTYQFWEYDSSQGPNGSPWKNLWHHAFGSEFHAGHGPDSTNTFKIVADSKTFTLVVNGMQVGIVHDSSFTSGSVGLFVNQAGTEVAFSDLLISA